MFVETFPEFCKMRDIPSHRRWISHLARCSEMNEDLIECFRNAGDSVSEGIKRY